MNNKLESNLKSQIQQVIILRTMIKDLEAKKLVEEEKLENLMKEACPNETTFTVGDWKLTRSQTVTYSLSQEGEKLLTEFPYETAYWKKTPNMNIIREDENLKKYIIEKIGKTKISLKENLNEKAEDLKS